MKLVCLDTQIIRWGVMRLKSKTPDAGQYIAKASSFIAWLESQRVDIILPTIILGELLVPIPPEQHPVLLSQMSVDWMIADYDARAAQQFATMRYETEFRTMMDDIRKDDPHATRKQILADAMIIATAIAHGAEKIYSHDVQFLRMASRYMSADNFLTIPIQTSFIQDEDED